MVTDVASSDDVQVESEKGDSSSVDDQTAFLSPKMRPIRGILELEVSLQKRKAGVTGLEFLSLGALPPVPIPARRVNLAGRRVMIIVKTRRLRPLSLGIILAFNGKAKSFFIPFPSI